MKELLIVSGKGGTGKTSITAAFASLAENKVMVDCDVDAADLHLILKPKIEIKNDFYGGKEAKIVSELCTKCGKCEELCVFDAITNFTVNGIKCEGCGVCHYFCPSKAILFEDKLSGEWYESNTRFGKLVHAKLGVAEENSGKLVAKIRSHARAVAEADKSSLIIVDGSPGIGCPVIASMTGTDLVLIIVEPTLSGIHDAERVIELTDHFGIPACVCINKYDINIELSNKIESFCKRKGLFFAGKVSYSEDFTKAQIKEKTIVEYSDGETSNEIKTLWKNIEAKLKEKKDA